MIAGKACADKALCNCPLIQQKTVRCFWQHNWMMVLSLHTNISWCHDVPAATSNCLIERYHKFAKCTNYECAYLPHSACTEQHALLPVLTGIHPSTVHTHTHFVRSLLVLTFFTSTFPLVETLAAVFAHDMYKCASGYCKLCLAALIRVF